MEPHERADLPTSLAPKQAHASPTRGMRLHDTSHKVMYSIVAAGFPILHASTGVKIAKRVTASAIACIHIWICKEYSSHFCVQLHSAGRIYRSPLWY